MAWLTKLKLCIGEPIPNESSHRQGVSSWSNYVHECPSKKLRYEDLRIILLWDTIALGEHWARCWGKRGFLINHWTMICTGWCRSYGSMKSILCLVLLNTKHSSWLLDLQLPPTLSSTPATRQQLHVGGSMGFLKRKQPLLAIVKFSISRSKIARFRKLKYRAWS